MKNFTKKLSICGTIQSGQILYLPKYKKDEVLELTINSNGGCGESTMGMFDMLEARRKKQKIVTVGVGQVESAAMWLFLCGDERKSYKHTIFMFHDADISGTKLSNMINIVLFKWNIIFKPCIRRCLKLSKNKDIKFWTDLFSGKERYFTAKEMKKMGLVTKII